jgi:hypothetical protein
LSIEEITSILRSCFAYEKEIVKPAVEEGLRVLRNLKEVWEKLGW